MFDVLQSTSAMTADFLDTYKVFCFQTQTFERVDVQGWAFGGELEVFHNRYGETNSSVC